MTGKGRKIYFVSALICLAGIVLSLISYEHYIGFTYGFHSGPTFCNINEAINCDAVTRSQWSSMFGIPLAGYGLAFYSALFIFSFYLFFSSLPGRRVFSGIFVFLGFLSILYAIFLFYISEFVVGSVCLVCCGMYLVNIGIFALGWLAWRELSLFKRFVEGARLLFGWPLKVLGILDKGEGVSGRSLRLSLLLLIALLIFSCKGLENLWVRYAQGQVASNVLEGWKNKKLISFNDPVCDPGMENYRQGPESAPIQVVEFSDYECPFCRRVHFVLKDLIDEYAGKVSVVFRNYPLDHQCNPGISFRYHLSACWLVHFARCAGVQGAYSEVSDLIFSLEAVDQGHAPTVIKDELLTEGKELGLDLEGLQDCISSGRHDKKIRADITAGEKAGLQGTPMIVVNGRYVGNPTSETLRIIFDYILEQRS